MPDSSDIDNALVAKLGTDAALLALAPNGAYWADEVPPGSRRFVTVSLVEAFDTLVFEGRSHESLLYAVEARMLSTPAGTAKAAAARIDALLDRKTLTVPGYSLMTMFRESRIREVEVDDLDPSIRWQRRGGNYRVVMSL